MRTERHSVTVVTGTRAEYGLLRPVLKKLYANSAFRVSLAVTGAHLSRAHGYTVSEIEADGLDIAARLDILSPAAPQGRAETACRTAMALRMFIDFLGQDPPDTLLALGDRYEMLAAGQAAALLGIPVTHISGGDVTAGADDDWFRHCLTKLSYLHFPSCEAYRRRIIRMGEDPGRVFNVGGLGDENIRSMPLLSHVEAERRLGAEIPRPYLLITLHPETACAHSRLQPARAVLKALGEFPQFFRLFTGANADAGGDEINAMLRSYCAANPHTAFIPSLGALPYLSLMKGAAAVIGNSSSGVVETPSFGTPAVDVGERQAGRLSAENILHCAADTAAVRCAISKAVSPAFAAQANAAQSPYNGGDTSGKIVAVMQSFLAGGLMQTPKTFYDGEDGTAK